MDDKAKKLARWFCVKMYLQEKHENNNFRNWFTVRGDIYTCHFGENIGDEKCGLGRPVLIVSADNINKKSGNVIVVTLSKNIKWKDPQTKRNLKYSTHYVLKKSKYPQLACDSVVQCEDIRVVSKARLGQYICSVDLSTDMKQIRKRLKSALQI
ncbi:type II toxin-antitoxin system PemK/MazF family toxin [Clostridium sp. cel8]|uniref:type II toxin-antitoxin system PemK/MazF family toxin n=1 Tax=Clostridium sp. cel8 TaxID=2663123 RepID=UPI0015F53C66|nr:type II toxin-antitoxin system PemK/MazF family toxin [Clostridium sp. cel8]MBA5850259.1 type II toxin-antitoxin system PemK/MazF family toxin [Clostridium sp. cel8]